MKSKILANFLLTAIMLAVLVSAVLTSTLITDTSTFGTNLNKTLTKTFSVSNNASVDVTGSITSTPITMVYSSTLFTSTNVKITNFNPSTGLTVPALGSLDILATVTAPYNAYMGKYSAPLTIGTEAFTLDVILASSDYDKNLNLDIDDESYPESIRVTSEFVIKKENNLVKNNGNDDADNVVVEAWLYDETDNLIVSTQSFTQGTVREDKEKEFDDDLELETTGLNPEHSFSLYIRAYSNIDSENFFVEKKEESIDLRAEEELCEVGDLELELDEDDIRFHGDEISPGEKITVPVTVTNKGSDTIQKVVVRAWICDEAAPACTYDDKSEQLDRYKVLTLDVKDIEEDDEAVFEIPLEIDEDVEDGSYNLRAEAFENKEEDTNCFGDELEIDIEKEDEELLITDIRIPEILACGESFDVEVSAENMGNDDLEDIFIKVFELSGKLGINELSDSFDLDEGDKQRKLFNLRIPTGIGEGDYTFVIATSNGDEDSIQKIVKVQGNCVVTPELSVSAVLASDAIAGEQLTIKATIKNLGDEQATYTISLSGYESFATLSKIEPSSLTLDEGASGDALIYLDANEDSSGEKTFKIQVTSEGQLTEQPVSLTIQPASGAGGFGITGSSILENLKGNLFIWVIVAINVILIIAIIIVASRLSR